MSAVQNCKPYRMNIMTLGVALLLASATTSILFDSRSARADTAKDIQLLSEATISLSEAIGIAEKHVGGKAIDAELDREDGKAVYDVSVIKAQSEFDVRLDAASGAVLHVKEDKK
ncbi:MAG: PepSY domain-containing protein [Alphaproteobacteria bacterium]|nr:PepSY domain-containing protein [Alphaproteobacteria bacterium]